MPEGLRDPGPVLVAPRLVATLARPVSLLLDAHHRVVDLLDGEQRLCGEGQVALAVDGDRAALAGLLVELHVTGLALLGERVRLGLQVGRLADVDGALFGQQLELLGQELLVARVRPDRDLLGGCGGGGHLLGGDRLRWRLGGRGGAGVLLGSARNGLRRVRLGGRGGGDRLGGRLLGRRGRRGLGGLLGGGLGGRLGGGLGGRLGRGLGRDLGRRGLGGCLGPVPTHRPGRRGRRLLLGRAGPRCRLGCARGLRSAARRRGLLRGGHGSSSWASGPTLPPGSSRGAARGGDHTETPTKRQNFPDTAVSHHPRVGNRWLEASRPRGYPRRRPVRAGRAPARCPRPARTRDAVPGARCGPRPSARRRCGGAGP